MMLLFIIFMLLLLAFIGWAAGVKELVAVALVLLAFFSFFTIGYLFSDEPSEAIKFAYQNGETKNITVASDPVVGSLWESQPYFYVTDTTGEMYILRNIWMFFQLKKGRSYTIIYMPANSLIMGRIIDAKEIAVNT